MNAHVHEFQLIAQDPNDAQVEMYEKLDAADLVKLIVGTHVPQQYWNDFAKSGWCECTNAARNEWHWKADWLQSLRTQQLLAPFYVYLKRLTKQ